MKSMKKTYLRPEIDLELMEAEELLNASNPAGFNGQLDDNNTIEVKDMLSRDNKIWDDDEE